MNTSLAEFQAAVGTTPSHSDVPRVNSRTKAARRSIQEKSPAVDSEEYKLLYLPTMVAVYTARHQQMPKSDDRLHRHIFGFGGHLGCQECREETEFLVAHQKEFF